MGLTSLALRISLFEFSYLLGVCERKENKESKLIRRPYWMTETAMVEKCPGITQNLKNSPHETEWPMAE